MSAPRPSPRLDGCARCGAATFVRVAPVREHGEGGAPAPMAVRWIDRPRDLGPFARAVSCVGPKLVPVPEGSFTVLICTRCGEARWYARDCDLGKAGRAAIGGCADCGEPRALHVPRWKTRGRGGQPSDLRVVRRPTRRWGFSTTEHVGHFSLFVCRGCARTTFVARELDGVAAHGGGAPCRRCAATARLTVEPVDEDGATLRVLYDRVHHRDVRVGRYRLTICTGCGLTDWTAHGIESLRADDAAGVALVEAGAQEGPYR